MASVPYLFNCCVSCGFVHDPNNVKTIGYVTTFKGLGMTSPLHADLTVFSPLHSADPVTLGNTVIHPVNTIDPQPGQNIQVVGVMEKFEWEGGVGHPISIDFHVSQENATQIKSLQQLALKTTRVDAVNWWIADYDQESKQWFERCCPVQPLAGTIANEENPELNVDLTPVPAADGVDVMVYKVSLAIAPPPNQEFALRMASSPATPVIKSWGLVSNAPAAPDLPTVP